ncbi:hypothetical protein ACF0H5_017511 [Mactra antiquata]
MGLIKYLTVCVIYMGLISQCLCIICTNLTDGVYEVNCRSYTLCSNGGEEIVNCDPGMAYNTKTQICESKWKVPPPCGTYRECSDKADGFYPDLETDCASYFVCSNGVFFGHSLCPGGLVYNVNQQVCDYKYSAPPPCGTNVSATAAPIVGGN